MKAIRSFKIGWLWLVVNAGILQANDKHFEDEIKPILEFVCFDCHSGKRSEAGFDLAKLTSADAVSMHHNWFKVADQVRLDVMPPEEEDPLDPADKKILLSWIQNDLIKKLVKNQRQEGRSRIRRLSREEYANTIEDVLGIRPPVARFLPEDGRIDGYSKVSQALPFSPAATDGYLQLAEQVLEQLLALPQDRGARRLWAGKSRQSPGNLLELPDNWIVSFNSDPNSGNLNLAKPDGQPGGVGLHVRKPGKHRLKIHGYAYQTDKPLAVGLYSGHTSAYPQVLELIDVIELPPKPSVIETEVYLPSHRDSDQSAANLRLIPFGLGVPVPKNSLASEKGVGAGMALQWVDVNELEDILSGQKYIYEPIPKDWEVGFRFNHAWNEKLIPADQLGKVVEGIIEKLGFRLYRRELSSEEIAGFVESLMEAVRGGSHLRDALVFELSFMMASPDSVCIVTKPGKLDDYALASRLSYFLWNSTPDQTLLDLAKAGKLTSDEEVLDQQVNRLLYHQKSKRFISSFVDQWLNLWAIDETTPDKDIYPEYDADLKLSSQLEARATFERLIKENRSVVQLVDPSWVMINERLAELYQIPYVEGFSIRSINLPGKSPYGGLLTQAAVMKVTANGTLTSPIKRGVWVSDRLLGIPIPSPPSNIEPVDPDIRGAVTLREQLQKHSQTGGCKNCHAGFDPYGFALESFDVMGNFRDHYRKWDPEAKKQIEGLAVESDGELPSGKRFDDIHELRALLASQPEQLAKGFVRHLLTYATGEPSSPIDEPAIEAIVNSTKADGYGMRSLILATVRSEVFRYK